MTRSVPDFASLALSSRSLLRELSLLLEQVDTGATPPQGEALLALENQPSLTSSELADQLGVDKSAISRTVAQLTAKRWVRTQADAEDRRRKPISANAKGRAQAARIRGATQALLEDALGNLDAELVRQMAEASEQLARTLRRSRRQHDFRLRPIERKDETQVATMLREVMTEMGLDDDATEDHELQRMHAAYTRAGSVYLVLEQGTRIVGGGGIAPLGQSGSNICELRKMYLRPEARGVGLGARVLSTCLREGKDRGYSSCYLETRIGMNAAQDLYEGFGFRRLERSRHREASACDTFFMRPL